LTGPGAVLPDDAALSAALRAAFPDGVRLLQATPDAKKGEGRFTLRIEAAGADRIGASPIEALLLPHDEFESARRDYEALGARVAAAPDLGLLLPLDGADRRLPSLRARLAPGCPWRLVRHRLERRAVLTRDDEPVYAKIFRSASRAEAAAKKLGIARAAGVETPVVTGVEPGTATVLTAAVPGRTLLDRLQEPGSPDLAASAGEAIARLAGSDVRTAIEDRHGLEDEIRVVRRWRDMLASIAPGLGAGIAPVLERAGAAARALPERAPVPAHRDFYDKQILSRDGAAAVVDWDSLALADPALDAANFTAHLRLRALQGLVTSERERELRASFLRGRGSRSCVEDRLAPFEALTLLRLSALYALRPPWAHLAPALSNAAEKALA